MDGLKNKKYLLIGSMASKSSFLRSVSLFSNLFLPLPANVKILEK